jgi:hypothetical protein
MADSSKAQCFLCQYFLGFKRIKVITPGWLLKVNPVFYDPGEICDEIIAKADAAFRQLSDKEIEEINSEFPILQDDQGQFDAPEFHLARRNLKGDTKLCKNCCGIEIED